MLGLETLYQCGKESKLKVRKFWGLILKFEEVTGGKLAQELFAPDPE